ncbi:MAG: helix-turn-helix transcriptional regulator [Deltaproteobacteria bacterium]|nr:helix-turn-helix transcriptional regulator [Deltaproteobacteria bacterium]
MTQEDLADAAGLDPKHLQRIEAARANPTIEVLHAIAEALGQPVARLLRKTAPLERAAGRPRKPGRRARH